MSTKKITISPITVTVLTISGAYLFFVTCILSPFLSLSLFFPSYTATKLFLVTSAALVALVQLFMCIPRFNRASIQTVPKIVKLLFGILLAGIMTSIILSYSPLTSLFGLYSFWQSNGMVYLIVTILGTAWFTYFLVLKTLHLDEFVFSLLMTLVIIITSLYAIGEFYIWHNATGYTADTATRVSLGFQNPLFAAYFIGVLWSFAAAKSLTTLSGTISRTHSLLQGLGSIVLYALNTLALILTFTRSAWVSAAVTGALLIIIILMTSAKNIGETLKKALVSGGILFIVTFLVAYPYRLFIQARNNDISAESTATLAIIARTLGSNDESTAQSFYQKAATYSSASIRLLEWKWGLRTWLGSPKNFLVGVGPDAGYFALPYYRDPVLNDIPTETAVKPNTIRSLYINFLMEYGVITTLTIVLLLLLAVKPLLKHLKRSPELIVPLAIIIGYFTQGLFYYASIIATLTMIFALGFTLSKIAPEDQVIISPPNTTEKALLTIVALFLLLWGIPLVQASIELQKYSRSPLPVSQEIMAKNTKILINNNIFKRFLAYHYATSPEAVQILPHLLASNNVDDLRVVGDAYYTIALSSRDTTALDFSIQAYEKLTRIEGTLPASWDALGLRYLAKGRKSDATKAFEKAVSLKEDYWYAYLHMGEALRQLCNPQEAIVWYKKAEKYVPLSSNEIQEAEGEIKKPRIECGGN